MGSPLRRARPAYEAHTFLKYSAFREMKLPHSDGRSSSGKIALTGHSSTHRPQSMQVSGSMYSMSVLPNSASFLVGWMQSTGHTSTQEVSLVPMQGSAMMWGMGGGAPG